MDYQGQKMRDEYNDKKSAHSFVKIFFSLHFLSFITFLEVIKEKQTKWSI